jgi:hypothetical protein
MLLGHSEFEIAPTINHMRFNKFSVCERKTFKRGKLSHFGRSAARKKAAKEYKSAKNAVLPSSKFRSRSRNYRSRSNKGKNRKILEFNDEEYVPNRKTLKNLEVN